MTNILLKQNNYVNNVTSAIRINSDIRVKSMERRKLVNIKLIFDAIAMPFGLIATFLIIFRNKRNIANILIGLFIFLGGFSPVFFGLLKEITYQSNVQLAILFTKFTMISIFWMTVPALSFSIFFWRAKYEKIPRLLHIFVLIPAIILTIWIFVVPNTVSFVETPYGINNVIALPLNIVSSIIIFLIFLLLLGELVIMARAVKSIPILQRRMNIFAASMGVGFGGAFIFIFLLQYFMQDILQPTALFVLIVTIIPTILFSQSISQERKQIWHGCPKLALQKDGSTICLNTEDGDFLPVKVLDLGELIERIQIDTEILKTGNSNCANTIFVDEENIVKCLTTHQPIMVLGEVISRAEMELARDMDILEGNELCSECLHKIIAYRKEHKEKTDSEIKTLFLGIRAEEFFGVC